MEILLVYVRVRITSLAAIESSMLSAIGPNQFAVKMLTVKARLGRYDNGLTTAGRSDFMPHAMRTLWASIS